jgi:DNA-binding transcriptional LysR family regulator
MTIATRAIPGAMAVQSSEPIDLAIARGPANRAPDSESALRVTIGRVEVRAVFPPPTPRRAQAAKPRPTLSLDDYLQRDLKRNINRDPGQR